MKSKNITGGLLPFRNAVLAGLGMLLAGVAYHAEGQSIQQIGYYSVNGVLALDAKPGYMMLGTGDLVDLSDPTQPVLSGSVATPALGSSVLVNGNYAYVGTGMLVGLRVVDISNPGFPVQVGALSFPQTSNGIFGLALQDSVLFLAMGDAGFYGVDVSVPGNPQVLDSIPLPNGQTRDVSLQGGFAFVAHQDGMKVIDISDPANLLPMTGIGSGYYSIDIENNLAFLGKTGGGVDVFDITAPVFPVPAFSIPNGGGDAWDLKVEAGHLYLATNSSGLFVYRIDNNSAVLKASWPNAGNGQSFGVALQDSLILLSGLINGVAILSYDSTGTTHVMPGPARQALGVHPNPASVYIEWTPFPEIAQVAVMNVAGERILERRIAPGNGRLDISGLSPGLYTVVFTRPGGRSYGRFVRTTR